MKRPLFRFCAAALISAPLLTAGAQIVATPPSDPIPDAPQALEKARSSLASKKGAKAADAYGAILQLRQVAEAYLAKGNARQSELYYRETLRLLRLLAETAPSFQSSEVARNIQEIEAALASAAPSSPAEKTMQIELTRASIQDGHLKVEWKLSPPDMTANEIERHLTFTIAMKLRDGSNVKKPKTVESLFLPSPTGEPNTYVASQDYLCPPTVKSVLLGVEFFDVNIFQQNQTVP